MLTAGHRTAGEVTPAATVHLREANRKQMSWQKTLMLAGVSLLLSAVATGSIAFIAGHILWE
jgi:hypothetical protein